MYYHHSTKNWASYPLHKKLNISISWLSNQDPLSILIIMATVDPESETNTMNTERDIATQETTVVPEDNATAEVNTVAEGEVSAEQRFVHRAPVYVTNPCVGWTQEDFDLFTAAANQYVSLMRHKLEGCIRCLYTRQDFTYADVRIDPHQEFPVTDSNGVERIYEFHELHYGPITTRAKRHWRNRENVYGALGVYPAFRTLQTEMLQRGYYLMDESDPMRSKKMFIKLHRDRPIYPLKLWHSYGVIPGLGAVTVPAPVVAPIPAVSQTSEPPATYPTSFRSFKDALTNTTDENRGDVDNQGDVVDDYESGTMATSTAVDEEDLVSIPAEPVMDDKVLLPDPDHHPNDDEVSAMPLTVADDDDDNVAQMGDENDTVYAL